MKAPNSRQDQVTPFLASLQWLSVRFRIVLKILLLTFKGLHPQAASYISEMLVPDETLGQGTPPVCSDWPDY